MSTCPRYYEGPQSRIVTIFILEEALGAVALAAVLCTLFSMPGVKRTATWFNVYMSFMIMCMTYLMLAVFGQAWGPWQPDFTICLFQASLLYAAVPLVSATLLSLCIELWIGLVKPLSTTEPIRIKLALILSPYLLWGTLLIESFIIGFEEGACRLPNHPYCTIRNPLPGRITQAIVAIIVTAAIVLLVLSAHRLWTVRSHGGDMNHPIRLRAYDALCRMGFFCLGGMLSIGLCIVFLKNGTPEMALEGVIGMIGIFPLMSVAILGSRREILDAWTSWFRRPRSFRSLAITTSPSKVM